MTQHSNEKNDKTVRALPSPCPLVLIIQVFSQRQVVLLVLVNPHRILYTSAVQWK